MFNSTLELLALCNKCDFCGAQSEFAVKLKRHTVTNCSLFVLTDYYYVLETNIFHSDALTVEWIQIFHNFSQSLPFCAAIGRFCNVEFWQFTSLVFHYTARYISQLCGFQYFSHTTIWFTDLDLNYIMISNRFLLVLLVSLELDVNQQQHTIIICWYMHEMLYFVIDLIAIAVGRGRLKLLTFINAAFSSLLSISQSTKLRLSSLRLCEFLPFSLTLYTSSLVQRSARYDWSASTESMKTKFRIFFIRSLSARCFSSELKMKSALVVWMNMICWEIAWV